MVGFWHLLQVLRCALLRSITSSTRPSFPRSALLNAQHRDTRSRGRQFGFRGEGGAAELLWFSGSNLRDDDESKLAEVEPKSVQFVADVAEVDLPLAPVPSAAEMRDENDKNGDWC